MVVDGLWLEISQYLMFLSSLRLACTSKFFVYLRASCRSRPHRFSLALRSKIIHFLFFLPKLAYLIRVV